MKKKLPLIIAIVLAICIVALCMVRNYMSRTKFNDTYVNGNSAGNLYNNGTYCEYNGVVYFANPSDSYKLYSMNSNGTNIQKLCDDIVSSINADENYVYYVRNNNGNDSDYALFNFDTNSLCRLEKKNKEITILDNDPCMYASLVQNYIYYLHYDTESASTLYRVKIDGTEKEQISTVPYYTCCTNGQYIYYNGIDQDHNVHQYDTVTKSLSTIYEGNCWMPILVDNDLYFMDCDDDYKIAKVNLTTGVKTTLTEDRVDSFNIYGSYLYYQDNTTTQFCRVQTDGTGNEVLFDGNYTHINITSYYIYFQDFTNETVYRVPTSDPTSIETFNPGASE